MIDIELAYYPEEARPSLKTITLPEGTILSTALQYLQQKGILEISLKSAANLEGRLGIFGKIVSPDTVLQAGDRIEIYRDLVIDPKEARRARANLNARALRKAWLAKKLAKKRLSSLDPSVVDAPL